MVKTVFKKTTLSWMGLRILSRLCRRRCGEVAMSGLLGKFVVCWVRGIKSNSLLFFACDTSYSVGDNDTKRSATLANGTWG